MPKAKKESVVSNEPLSIPEIDFPKHSEEEVVVTEKKDKKSSKKEKLSSVEEKHEEGENEGGLMDKFSSVFNQRERLKSIYMTRPALAKIKAPMEVAQVDSMPDDEVKSRIAVCEAALANETSGSVAESVLYGVSTFVDKIMKLDGKLVARNMSDESLKQSLKTVLGSRLFVYLSEEVKIGGLFGLNIFSSVSEKKADEMIRQQVGNVGHFDIKSKSNNVVANSATAFNEQKEENNIVVPSPALSEMKAEFKENVQLSEDPNKIF